jgi:hypothetical protein
MPMNGLLNSAFIALAVIAAMGLGMGLAYLLAEII